MLRLALWAAAAVTAAAAPCVTGTADCTEPLPMGPAGRFVTVYRSHPLAAGHATAKRALVVIHGAGRNADEYFPSGMAGAFLAGALEETVVVAPRFAGAGGRNCADKLAEGEIGFACAGSDWRGGGPGVGVDGVTSYDVIDELIRRFADKAKFPQLRHVVLMGHSAGGQFLSRYAAAAKEPAAGVAVRYVVSNPSSYLYLDEWRPAAVGAACAADFNDWKYGLKGRAGYAAGMTDTLLKENLAKRDVVYLLGGYDTTPQFGFDATCPAMAQGATRLERGVAYHTYITGKYGAKHRLVKVPNCGHNGRCMLVADEARGVLFP
jgi:pimeloyl-ACP methyl ester carboxylesterase